MIPLPPRSFKRSLFTSYLDVLQRTGLLVRVRAGAGAELAALLDRPRGAGPWMPGATFDELNAALEALAGREAVRQLGLNVMKRDFTLVLEPIIHLSLSLLGASPASLFSRAHLMLAVISHGVEMKWTPAGRSGGTMQVVCGDAVPSISWAAWEGCFLYILELAAATGTVCEARSAADGRGCAVDVAWTAK